MSKSKVISILAISLTILLFTGAFGSSANALQGPVPFDTTASPYCDRANDQFSSMGIIFNDAYNWCGALYTYAKPLSYTGPTVEIKFVDLQDPSIAASTDYFNLDIYGIDGGPVYPYVPYIAAYDYYGNLLGESHATFPTQDSETQMLDINFTGMHELVLHNESHGSLLWYNITFNDPQSLGSTILPFGETAPIPTPEPSTMLLLGSGLFGVIAFRKKFKK